MADTPDNFKKKDSKNSEKKVKKTVKAAAKKVKKGVDKGKFQPPWLKDKEK
jgi:hypothetical protein